MATEQKLFEDAYQSVTQPFEQSTAQVPAPDQGTPPVAEEAPTEGAPVETPEAPETTPASSEGNKEEQVSFNLESFNKHFESEFKDESSLKEILSSQSKLSEYQKQLQDKENALKAALAKSSQYDDLVDNLDPEKLYGDKELYTAFKLKEKFPDKDPSLLLQIKGPAFDVMSDMDKLVLVDKLKIKSNISDTVRQKAILDRLGIEADDLSELTDTDRYKLASAVAEQDSMVSEIRGFTPEPMKIDFTAQKEARKKEIEARQEGLKKSWDPLAKSLLKNYEKAVAYTRNDKGDYQESFSFAVDDKFRDEFYEPYMTNLLNSGMEPTEENLKIAATHIDERFKIMNFDRIVNEAIKFGRTHSEDEAHKLIHNDKPQNTATAPVGNQEGKFLTLKEQIKQRVADGRK